MSSKSKSTTFLLCYFFGWLGVHRFYLGKFITGILMPVTLGGSFLWSLVDLNRFINLGMLTSGILTVLTLTGFFLWWLVDFYRVITGRLKDKQGNELSVAPPNADQPNAGFWVRFSAMTIDGLLIWLVVFVFIDIPFIAYLYTTGAITPSTDPQEAQMAIMQIAPVLTLVQGVTILLWVGYFVVLTAGKHQGTYGKRSMGIYVRKRDGGRVWYGHSLVRFVGYLISWIPLGIGYLMAGFGKRKLALHDLIAGTEVVYGTPEGEAVGVAREPVTEVLRPEPSPVPMTMEEASPSRFPEILVGTGLLLLAGAAAMHFMR